MSYVITVDEQEVSIPVSIRGGILHFMIRAKDEKTFTKVATEVGLLVENEDGVLEPLSGVTMTKMGLMVLEAAEFDILGEEVKAAKYDKRFHANFWFSPKLTEAGVWKDWATEWLSQGSKLTSFSKNKAEDGWKFKDIELIDPDTVSSPSNVIL